MHAVLDTSNTRFARLGNVKGVAKDDRQTPYNSDPSPQFRLSRVQALQDTVRKCKLLRNQIMLTTLDPQLSETQQYMEDQGVSEHEPILCGRRDCTDRLRDLQALMRPLHIHNLHDNAYVCRPSEILTSLIFCSNTVSRCERCDEHEMCMRRICRPQRLRGRGRLNSLPDCASGITSPIKGEYRSPKGVSSSQTDSGSDTLTRKHFSSSFTIFALKSLSAEFLPSGRTIMMALHSRTPLYTSSLS